ncbi:hypothetical protein THARTR1_03947 [Trichoderma harzianum]|uniref:Uncharacterized protein n=1 Tax=Trichoderma harzianum TaxID=5544 RepID=A0A2K0UE04_TRIHA|nr:hypothetical protein THARTR1_03947 [Trichoderma harzianum]
MPSKRKNTTQKTVLELTHKDLVRHTDGNPEQVKKGDPEWNDGIRCINAYRSQATVLSQADQEEMRDIIRRLDYVISPEAKNAPLSHTLMKAEYKKLQEGGSLSWAVFIILKTVYGDALPTKYVDCIRNTIGETELDNHTDEYLAIMATSTEPTEPLPKSK